MDILGRQCSALYCVEHEVGLTIRNNLYVYVGSAGHVYSYSLFEVYVDHMDFDGDEIFVLCLLN